MTDESKAKPAAGETETRAAETDQVKLYTIDKQREQREGARIEAERRRAALSLIDDYEQRLGEGSLAAIRSLADESPDFTVERTREEINKAILNGYVSVDVSAKQDDGSSFRDMPKFDRIKAGEDKSEKFERAMTLSLQIQANQDVDEKDKKEVRGTEWYGMSVAEMARNYLRMTGQRPVGDKHQVIGMALRSPSHGSSHFASVLENVASKSMVAGFQDADETWMRWANTRSVPDFKPTSLLNMSLFSDLDQIRENGEYEYGDMSDIKETITLATYGKLFGISRVALANDDLSALGQIPRAMGNAAARTIGDKVYEVLTTGTTATMLQDSTALFAAGHGNYVTSGAAPSVTTLDAGRTAMATQTDPAGKTIGLRARHLIVPIALQTTADVLIAAQYDPAGTAGTLKPNPFQGTMQVTADHRLDTFNSSGWFLAAATNQVTVAFLNGQQTPYLESRDGWNIDGVEFKTRIDVASVPEDYRGLYYNDGVT